MNTSLVNFYMSKPKVLIPASAIHSNYGEPKANAINILNNSYQSWTYEITKEEYVEQDTGYFVSLVIYAPGFVQSGVGRTYSDFNRNYKLEAINDALLEAMKGGLLDNLQVVNFDNRDNTKNENKVDMVGSPSNNSVHQGQQSQGNNQNKPTYSNEQIQRMSKFKNDYNIKTDVELMNYIQRWDPSIKRKGELTPFNIDNFLSWVDKLGGM